MVGDYRCAAAASPNLCFSASLDTVDVDVTAEVRPFGIEGGYVAVDTSSGGANLLVCSLTLPFANAG